MSQRQFSDQIRSIRDIAECSEGTNVLKRQPYPATAAKSGQVVAPFRVTMPISKDVLDFVGEKPRVGYWNPEDTEWQFEGITAGCDF